MVKRTYHTSRQPVFTGTDEEKQKAYSKWRSRWFKLTQKRKIAKHGENKKGRPR